MDNPRPVIYKPGTKDFDLVEDGTGGGIIASEEEPDFDSISVSLLISCNSLSINYTFYMKGLSLCKSSEPEV